MTHEAIKKVLLSLPAATMTVQWKVDEVFKVGGKMFAVTTPTAPSISFKADDASFEILTQLPGITPAPYLARAKWVFLDRYDRLSAAELKAYLARAHKLVAAGLTKKRQRELFAGKLVVQI